MNIALLHFERIFSRVVSFGPAYLPSNKEVRYDEARLTAL